MNDNEIKKIESNWGRESRAIGQDNTKDDEFIIIFRSKGPVFTSAFNEVTLEDLKKMEFRAQINLTHACNNHIK